ncbi:protein-disulfide reductase DsbD domain-containing protein [Mucilaginibacter aquaedulcis]|uniref:protein-disulfide reductase DsbD domain-containing protein n=1 Tax=Mucilaginibacter aquaedulcis TaxID=1187081 RepID=UPI0025B43AE2|nr:protein-disulfide reductase DsbD domain-containing protein [Mucilaginibacter aquaedulcis]MDN3547421.1 protein-disulfide reductase DsbD family protein [Mucilaginibacter aquaedulcis]
MKKIILTAICITLCSAAFSQILTPVKWSYASKRIDKEQAVLLIRATIDKGWHIYSQHVADGGPIKTTLKFEKNDDYILEGSTIEPKPISEYEKSFSMNVQYFEQAVTFQQKIKLKAGQTTVKGTINFMVCNAKQCLPPDDVEFNIPVK